MNNKMVIAFVGVIVALCIGIVAVVGVTVSKNKNEDASVSTELSQGDVASTTAPGADSTVTNPSTTAPSVPQGDISKQIIGKWMDSANMSGFEFFENGNCTVTYVNLTVPILNLPINGTANGTYTLEGNKLSVHFSIYSGSVDKNYTAVVTDNNLELTNLEDGEKTNYMKSAPSTTLAPDSTTAVAENTSIIGSWDNSDGTVSYSFFENGTLSVTFKSGENTKTYSGVYMLLDDDLTVQFKTDKKEVFNKYKIQISGKTLSLKSTDGTENLFVRVTSGTELLLGKWTDSTDLSGFEFKQNNVVSVTLINFTIPVVNMPINGTFEGTYSIKNGNQITVSYTALGNTVVKDYSFDVTGNSLTLTDTESGTISTYTRVG